MNSSGIPIVGDGNSTFASGFSRKPNNNEGYFATITEPTVKAASKKNLYSKPEFVYSPSKNPNRLADLLIEESRSATKKFDYLKLMNSENKNIEVAYGNGLSCKNKGKSPLTRNFIMTLKGDTNGGITVSDSL